MKVAILQDNVITNIILVKKINDVVDAKFLSNKSTLNIGDQYDQDLAQLGGEPPAQIIDIVISNVSNTLADFDSNDNEYTVEELTDCLATGTAAIPNKNFRVPFYRIGANGIPDAKRYMPANVTDGNFSITLNFKTGGEWFVDSELLNSELTQQELALFKFSIEKHVFKVI